MDPADLRRNIGVVMQESWLFSGTVKQNIAVGGNILGPHTVSSEASL
jgi:ATP-binding cassette subfamily C protein LapB